MKAHSSGIGHPREYRRIPDKNFKKSKKNKKNRKMVIKKMKIQQQKNAVGQQWVYIPQWVTNKLKLKKGDILSIIKANADEITLKVIRAENKEEG